MNAENNDIVVEEFDDTSLPEELRRKRVEVQDEETGEILFVQDEEDPEDFVSVEDKEEAEKEKPPTQHIAL